ncbi:hypothetical protein ACLK2E_12330 [Escherichia coli]
MKFRCVPCPLSTSAFEDLDELEELAVLAVRALDALLDSRTTQSRRPNAARWAVVRWVLG